MSLFLSIQGTERSIFRRTIIHSTLGLSKTSIKSLLIIQNNQLFQIYLRYSNQEISWAELCGISNPYLFQPIKPQSAVLDSQAMISAVSLSADHHHHCRDAAASSALLLSPCVGTIKETQVQHFSQHWFCHKIITDTPTAAGKVPCHLILQLLAWHL